MSKVLWKQGRGAARAVLKDIADTYGEAFVVEWLEQRLDVPKNTAPGPLKAGDTVRILPRQPGQRREAPGYTDEMQERFADTQALVYRVGGRGRLITLSGSTFTWLPHWLEKVED